MWKGVYPSAKKCIDRFEAENNVCKISPEIKSRLSMQSFHRFLPVLVLLLNLNKESHGRPKSWREGPTVDPGVFVITHIR